MGEQSDQPGQGSVPPRSEAERATFRRVENIYFEVAALAPADRDAAIARLCEGDPTIESSVRALVGSAARIGSFLEQPALGRGLDQVAQEAGVRELPDDLVGATIGSFRIIRRIASGGMGVVYLAARSDGQFEQTVAMKIVKRGMDSEEILRRFRAERQMLAALDHPNIAGLLDGGVTPDGRPFLVMEYVDGKPIDTYCDEHRLRVRERLELFRAVCDAVHHAHKNLVIHRDLKPSNILVTPQGVPKLLDFGIAKVLTGSATTEQVTLDTDRRLTPEYASPEQIQGASATTATDVYSLGVILYQLLTGSYPYSFGQRTLDEYKRIVCTVIPPPPSAAITVRASRQRPTSRPANPLSTPPTPPTASTPTSPTLLTDAGGTRGVSSTRLRSQLRGDLDNIVLMALRKEPQRRYASAEQFGADIGRYLEGMPVQARKDTPLYRASKFIRRHPVGVSLTIAVVITLSTSTVLLERQGTRLERQRDELAVANRRLEETRRYLQTIIGGAETGNQGPDAKLGAVLAEAAKALETSPPSDPITRAAAEQAIGRAEMSLGLLPEARRLLQLAQRDYGTQPDHSDVALDLRADLAQLLFFEGQYAQAEAEFRALLAIERLAAGTKHTEREGMLLNNLGSCLRLQLKLDQAIATQREAILVRAAVSGENSLATAESRNNLASALFQSGDTAAAIDQFEKALAIRKSLLRTNHPLIIRVQANLGLALLRTQRIDESVNMLEGAAQSWDAAFGPDHPGRIATITSLSMALRRQSKYDNAVAWLNKALDWQTAHQPGNTTQLAATQANIGVTLAEQHKDAEAEKLLFAALPTLRSAGKPMQGITSEATTALADVYERSGRQEEARRLRESLSAADKP